MAPAEAVRRATVHLALWTVAVTQPLLGLYGDNLAVFTSAKIDGPPVVVFALLVALVPAFAVASIDLSLSVVWSRASGAIHRACVFAGAWAVALLVFRSVSAGPWPVDAAGTGLLAGLGVVGYVRWKPLRTWVSWTSPLSLVVLVAFVVAVAPVAWPPEPGRASDGRRSAAHVVWIVLDEAPLWPLVASDGSINSERFGGFGRLASTSTWYRNAATSSSRTIVSVASMLTGREPDYSRQPVLADHPDNLFTNAYGAMDLDVLEEATALCAGSWCEHDEDEGTETALGTSASLSSFVRDATVVLGHTILPRALRESLPPIDEGWGGFAGGTRAPSAGAGNGDGDDEQIGALPDNRARLEHMEEVGQVVARAERPTLAFAHVIVPHRPWVLAPDQRMSTTPIPDIRPSTSIDRRRDAYQSMLNQYLAVDAQINRLMDTLEASPNWDKTMIVVTADHGITFVPGVGHRKTDPSAPGTIDDVFRVPMFVRYPGQRTGEVNDCPALSIDLLPTVAEATGLTPGWSPDGVNLASTCPTRATRPATWSDGATTLSTGVEDLMARVHWYGDWVRPDGVADDIYRIGPYGSLVGTPAPDSAPVDTGIEWYFNNAGAFSNVSSERFGLVPTRAVGRMTARRPVAPDEEVLVAVDGVFVGIVREVSELVPGRRTYFAASLMSRLIGAGSHEVSLWSVRGGAANPVLSRLGPATK
jgi:hypothetical protein